MFENQPRKLEELGISGKIALCLSGGVDSFIGKYYLELNKCDYTSVYFHLGSKYSTKELLTVMKLANVTIDDSLQWLGEYETGEKAFVPFRNLYLAMVMATKYAENVCICGISGDEVEDKNETFFNEVSELLSRIGRKKIKVFSPFWETSKAEMVGWYLRTGGDRENLIKTISCYDGETIFSCNKCPSCFRRFVALYLNGINVGFENFKLAKRYYDDCLAGKYDKKRQHETMTVFEDYWEKDGNKRSYRGSAY